MKLDIALAADANYFPGLLVTAVSLARHASHEVALVFHVLDGGLGAEKMELLRRKLREAHPRTEVCVYDVDATRFSDFPEWTCGSRMAYARLVMAELVEAADGWLLYCDVDYLWCADVAELWAMRLDDVTFLACADGWAPTLEKEGAWFASKGLAFNAAKYFCSGLLLVNMNRWREKHVARRVMDFLKAHHDVQYADQTALNAVVEDVGSLSPKWGRFARTIQAKDVGGAWAIHFAGGAPWCSNWWTSVIGPADLLWYRIYGELLELSPRAVHRRFLTTKEFIQRRVAYILSSTPVVRSLFFLFLRCMRRGAYVESLNGV